MTGRDAGRRAKVAEDKLCRELELALQRYGVTTTAHYEPSIRALFAAYVDAAVAEAVGYEKARGDAYRNKNIILEGAVKEREAEIAMLRGACREKETVGDRLIVQLAEAHKERDRLYMEMGKTIARQVDEARREERQHCIDVCESIGAGYVGTGQAVAKQIAQTLRPPASAPEGEK